ncbi:MAG: NAD(P)H-hydrate epimerase, partial [Marmoricola sp.]
MRRAHTVGEVRAAEAARMAEVPEGALMQRAAAGLATAVADLLDGRVYGARVLLLVGSGDNGGDALYAGARLAARGAAVEAVLLSDRAHGGGVEALRTSGGRLVDLDSAHEPQVVLDGIVGIGGRPGLRPTAEAAVRRFPDALVVAVDVPSGVAVDTGALEGWHVRADVTVTFGTLKPCHLVDPAALACGVLDLVDLDLDLPPAPVEALGATDVAALVPQPSPTAQKYTRGVVGLRTGSAGYPGAAVLGVAGAGTGLCGMVRYSGGAADAVRADHPEVVVSEGRVQAWVVGSGSGEDAGPALARALEDDVPVVVDADALRHIRAGDGTLVLTPHAGELATILGVERTAVEA